MIVLGRRLAFASLLLVVAAPAADADAQTSVAPPVAAPAPAPSVRRPFRLESRERVPEWLRFGFEHRLRFEHLRDDFRQAATGDSRGLSMRTLARLELRFAPFAIGGEFMDARLYANAETPLSTTLVDSADLLQAYVALRGQDVFASGDRFSLTAGRMTIDVGSRRLVARNDFRNTINAFTGADFSWTQSSEHVLRAFAVMPVTRRPTDAVADVAALADNAVRFDRENPDTWLLGATYATPEFRHGLRFDAYALTLLEHDSADVATANRRLATLGFRVRREPRSGQVDFHLELMGQFGVSRATIAATDVTDLDHRAGSVSMAIGYKLDGWATPRLALLYDFASGDRDPTDARNGRFDALYGARRFDFGPTGLFGAFSRANIQSPGVRLEGSMPHDVGVAFTYRAAFLAQARDAWVPSRYRDTSGASGTFLGHQLDFRLRYAPYPGNLVFELGMASLVRGEFARTVPMAKTENPLYLYLQVTATL